MIRARIFTWSISVQSPQALIKISNWAKRFAYSILELFTKGWQGANDRQHIDHGLAVNRARVAHISKPFRTLQNLQESRCFETKHVGARGVGMGDGGGWEGGRVNACVRVNASVSIGESSVCSGRPTGSGERLTACACVRVCVCV